MAHRFLSFDGTPPDVTRAIETLGQEPEFVLNVLESTMRIRLYFSCVLTWDLVNHNEVDLVHPLPSASGDF
jgi:hypothetical protein